jgi:hypothetical protein
LSFTVLVKVCPPSATVTVKRRLFTRLSALRLPRESLNVTLAVPVNGDVNDFDAIVMKRFFDPIFTRLVLLSRAFPALSGVASKA